jgi:hypothetical protein
MVKFSLLSVLTLVLTSVTAAAPGNVTEYYLKTIVVHGDQTKNSLYGVTVSFHQHRTLFH